EVVALLEGLHGVDRLRSEVARHLYVQDALDGADVVAGRAPGEIAVSELELGLRSFRRRRFRSRRRLAWSAMDVDLRGAQRHGALQPRLHEDPVRRAEERMAG